MIDGWYCGSVPETANVEDETGDDDDESQDEIIDYKEQYKSLKRKLRNMIYENEIFQETLRSSQRRLMIATQDRSFLLDRLLLYERVENSTSESEETESSDDQDNSRIDVKKRKVESMNALGNQFSNSKTSSSVKKKKISAPKTPKQIISQPLQTLSTTVTTTTISDGHMTPEEVERHLQSRQTYLELLPERAPPTVPTEMFSNDPSLDSESNDVGELETSPSNMGEDLSVDMMAE